MSQELDSEAFREHWAEVKAASARMVGPSLVDRLSLIESHEPGFAEKWLESISPVERVRFFYAWRAWARPKQLPPSAFFEVWLLLGGRGVGKTRTGAEWVADRIIHRGAIEIILGGPTVGDVWKTMLGGHEKRSDGRNGSGLFDILPPWVVVEPNHNTNQILFPQYGARVDVVSGERPEIRGPNPDTAWLDEIIKWKNAEVALSNLRLAVRKKGKVVPQMAVTTTPRPLNFLRQLVADAGTITYHSRSAENRANLAQGWLGRLQTRMGGTREGMQELEAEILGDNPGSLFPMSVIDKFRATLAKEELEALLRAFTMVCVVVDPAVSLHRKSDDTGISALGRTGEEETGEVYVLEDGSGRYQWEGWGEKVLDMCEKWNATHVLVERNRVGDGALSNVRQVAAARGYEVRTRPGAKHLVMLTKGTRRIMLDDVLAVDDKAARAGPVSTAYHKGRVHHVGRHADAEDEMSEWDPTSRVSPNRLDTVVHGVRYMLGLDKAPAVDAREGFRGLVEAVTSERVRPEAEQESIEGLLAGLSRGYQGPGLL